MLPCDIKHLKYMGGDNKFIGNADSKALSLNKFVHKYVETLGTFISGGVVFGRIFTRNSPKICVDCFYGSVFRFCLPHLRLIMP